MAVACSLCEEDEWEILDDGMCQSCSENSGAAKYCCGAIYEDDEDTCRSCGEPL